MFRIEMRSSVIGLVKLTGKGGGSCSRMFTYTEEQIWVVLCGVVVCVVNMLVCMNALGCVVRGGFCLHFLYNSTISMHVCLAADSFFYTFAHGGNRLCGSFFGVYRCKVLDTITHKITWQ